ncbi:MAG: type II secretion system F family protein [Candidatus Altiarchaeota archaeon]
MRVIAMVIPQRTGKRLAQTFQKQGEYLTEFVPELKSDVVMANIDMSAEEYVITSIFSAITLGMLLFAFTYVPLAALELAPGQEFQLAAIPAAIILILDFFILLRYPRILALKRAELVDKDLIYALKDLLLNISAGLSLFDSIKRVSESDHGLVSRDLRQVIEETNQGAPLDEALETLALRTSSDYMRNAIWQIVNAVKSGTSIKEALSGLIQALIRDQKMKIQNYIQELNVLSMVYMLFAVAIPTIITTVLVVLTSLMGTGINETSYTFVLAICISIQIGLVGLIKSRRPLIYSA